MITFFQVKKMMASLLDRIYINNLLYTVQISKFYPFVRAINYHDVPSSQAKQFEKHLQYYEKTFSPVGYEDLLHLLQGNWKKDRPGLVLSFDDGFRSASEIVAPLLEKYGFVGWFFVPSSLIDLPVDRQVEKAFRHRVFPKSQSADHRVFLTWEQVIELDRKHFIGCHTASHCRLKSTLNTTELHHEIIHSKQLLEKKLDHEVKAFAWVGGEESSYSRQAAEWIRKANYQLVFLTNNSVIRAGADYHLLDRTNIESDFPCSLMRFQISGIMDLLYAPKRRRVSSLIRQQPTPLLQ